MLYFIKGTQVGVGRMAVGDRIRLIRNLRGLTQKQLGFLVGFNNKTADVRIAQYESGTRTPKDKMIDKLAYALGTSPEALVIPEEVDNEVGMMHTLFVLEDLYGLQIKKIDGELCLTLDKSNRTAWISVFDRFAEWHRVAEKLKTGEITKEEYDEWRYRYPLSVAERFEAELNARLRQNKEEK